MKDKRRAHCESKSVITTTRFGSRYFGRTYWWKWHEGFGILSRKNWETEPAIDKSYRFRYSRTSSMNRVLSHNGLFDWNRSRILGIDVWISVLTLCYCAVEVNNAYNTLLLLLRGHWVTVYWPSAQYNNDYCVYYDTHW